MAPARRRRPDPDEGSAAIGLVLAVVGLLATVLMTAAAVGNAVVERADAQAAADAVALAGVVGDRAVATAVARRHDATIESWYETRDVVTVVVRVGAQTATARATDALDERGVVDPRSP